MTMSQDKVTRLADRQKSRAKVPPRAVWLKDAMCDDRGRPVANLANAMVALRLAPELVSAFAYDEMMGAPILMATLPVVDDGVVEPSRSLGRYRTTMSAKCKSGCSMPACRSSERTRSIKPWTSGLRSVDFIQSGTISTV